MVVRKEPDSSDTEMKYSFNRRGGKSIIERQPVFSPDGESLAVIVENTVRVYNTQTGDCARILETESHNDELIAIEFPGSEQYNLYGCSIEGCITVWTWENGVVLRETKLDTPRDKDILTFNLISNTDCLLVLGSPSHEFLSVVSFSMRAGEGVVNYHGTQPKYSQLTCTALGWFNGDRFAAISNGTKTLCVQNLAKPAQRSEIQNYNKIRIIALAVHNDTISITDAMGRVTLLRGNFFDKRGNVGREVLHWHFLPVMSIAFSLQGNYVYTGGIEKVLVKWTIGGIANKAHEKHFIPRLPGHVRFIATNNTHVAATLSNNSIVVANAQMRATCTILECGGVSPTMRAVGGRLIFHPRLGGLLIPGRTGHLQLYSTANDKVLYNVDITQMNDLPAERYNLIPLDTEVTCAAVSANGNFLATSEYRNDGINFPEEKLKFWYASMKGATPFVLNTCVNLSHGGCNVVALEFDSQGNYCVSAGTDQRFRIWKKENQSLSKDIKRYFFCITACYYSSGIGQFLSHDILNRLKHHDVNTYSDNYPYFRDLGEEDIILKLRNIHKEKGLVDANVLSSGMKTDDDLDMGGIAISQDGSLIAAWFGCKLTLWDTHLCNIRTTLSNPVLRPKGKLVMFGRKDAAHYLVCTTENCLAVWSLLSLTIKWYVNIKTTCLAYDRQSNRMAVTTKDNDVIVFTPHSPTPILTRKKVLNPATGVFSQITFGATTGEDIKLFLMRNNSEIYSIEPEQEKSQLEVMSWLNKPVSKFGALIAEQKQSDVRHVTPGEVELEITDANAAVAQIISADPHMVPPVSLLCTAFLQQLSNSKEPEAIEEDDIEENMEVDQLSDDEDKNLKEPAPQITELWTPNYEAVKQKKLIKIIKEPFLDLHSTSELFQL